MAGTRVGIGERARALPSCGCRGGRDPEDLPRRATGWVIEELAQLGEAQLDESDEALADASLFGHEGHREPRRLAQLDTDERIAGVGLFAHGHLGEAPRIGRVGLRASEPTLGKVLRCERVDHRDRMAPVAQVGREGHPVVARGFHRDQPDGLGLSRQPGVECIEAGAVLAHPQDRSLGLDLPLPAAGHRMLPTSDVDADGDHPEPPSDTQGIPPRPVDVS